MADELREILIMNTFNSMMKIWHDIKICKNIFDELCHQSFCCNGRLNATHKYSIHYSITYFVDLTVRENFFSCFLKFVVVLGVKL